MTDNSEIYWFFIGHYLFSLSRSQPFVSIISYIDRIFVIYNFAKRVLICLIHFCDIVPFILDYCIFSCEIIILAKYLLKDISNQQNTLP